MPSIKTSKPNFRPVYVLCYDIRDPKRLKKLHRHVSKHAVALQYSVFLILHAKQAHKLFKQASHFVKPEDDIRMYKIKSRQSLWLFGNKVLKTNNDEKQNTKSIKTWFSGLFKV